VYLSSLGTLWEITLDLGLGLINLRVITSEKKNTDLLLLNNLFLLFSRGESEVSS